jgi:hypothetical protein
MKMGVNAFILLILVVVLACTGKIDAPRPDKDVPAKGKRDCVHERVVDRNSRKHRACMLLLSWGFVVEAEKATRPQV